MVPDEKNDGGMREARNEIEKWIAQLEIQARVAQATGGGQQKKNARGRPETFAKAPVIEQKGGGDSTVRTSAH
jgi:hypothetical protein